MAIPSAAKPIWWKVFIGALLALAEFGAIFGRRPVTAVVNTDQQQGMGMMQVVLLLIGLWLIWSGMAPVRKKVPGAK
jgi:hypothetical protein